jgi:ABC-type Zn2+ transport system substrate-binding protein/surface adhesin
MFVCFQHFFYIKQPRFVSLSIIFGTNPSCASVHVYEHEHNHQQEHQHVNEHVHENEHGHEQEQELGHGHVQSM